MVMESVQNDLLYRAKVRLVVRSTQMYIELMETTVLILSAYQRRRHLYTCVRPSLPLRHPATWGLPS